MMSWTPGDWWPAIANLAGLLVWGGVTHQRIKTLEREVDGMSGMDSRLARVEARLDGLYEQFKELNASIRWMRSPEPPPRPRRRVTERDDG